MTGPAPFDIRDFRGALGNFATGVTIVTTRGADGAPVGVTASSFNSVSLNPPMVLWSLAKTARSFDAFETASHWAVHILAADQDALSNRFAKSGENKFAGLEIDSGAGDTPLLKNCASCFQCKTAFKYEGGDHLIFVGEVVAYTSNEKPPLVFHGGKYALAAGRTEPMMLSGGVARESNIGSGEDFLGYLLWRANFHFHEQIATHLSEEKLNEDGFMILARVLHHNGCTQAQLRAGMPRFSPAEVDTRVASLEGRGLLRCDETDGRIWLSVAGRESIMRIDAASRVIETNLLKRMKPGEALAFKHMLRRFIVDTNGGLPHPWEDSGD